jgi:poly-gamma-glutamate synthesis protein (capsule biosynthesis protein)
MRLLANGRPLVVARSGALGKFALRFRAPSRSARYRLVLHAGERRTPLADLVVRPVVLAAVGDVNLGDRIGAAIRSYGSGYPWTSAAPLLRAADLAIANLESAVSTRGTPAAKKYTFRGDPSAVPAVARAGIDVVSVANNHSLDFGAEAFLDTLRHVRRAGIATVGGGRDAAAARRPAIVTAGGLRIAILGYSDVRPLGFDATPSRPGTARADVGAIAADVRAARRRTDAVVVYFHWGTERARTPDARQRSFAAAALDGGATVVLGAHPHVLQPIERRGRRLVAWSLGNFVFGATSAGTGATGVLTIGLDRAGVRWNELVPARIDGVRPILDRSRARATLARLARASR